MKIRLAKDLDYDSIVDGEGIRAVIWTQGCIHNCPFCHNPETHSLDGGFLTDTIDVIKTIKSIEHQDGITLSGGDPMLQIDDILEICKATKEIGLNIWVYTGFTFDTLLERSKKEKNLKELLKNIDVLVDGKFMIEKKSYDVIFRGSTNQRIIDVKKSLEQNRPIEVAKYKQELTRKFERKTYV